MNTYRNTGGEEEVCDLCGRVKGSDYSLDFCGQACQREYLAKQSEPLEEERKYSPYAGDLPNWAMWGYWGA